MDSKMNLQWVVRQEALTPSVVKRGPRGQGQPQPLRPDEVASAVGSRELWTKDENQAEQGKFCFMPLL